MTQKYLQIPYRAVAAFGLGAAAVLLALLMANMVGASVPAERLAVAAAPQVVNYQGTVEIASTLYEGTGFFKFALVDSDTGDGSGNYWANDGTASGEPSQTVPLTVSAGLFSVLLGDTAVSGMTVPLTDAVFSSGDTYLRVWFSQELAGPFEALEPNQRIGSVPYALRAAYAETGSAMVPAGAVMFFNGGSCPSGWSELTQARGRTIVGLPGSGTLSGTQGTALTDLENRTHSHVVDPDSVNSSSGGGHYHTLSLPTLTDEVSYTSGFSSFGYARENHVHNVSPSSLHNHTVDILGTESSTASTSEVIPYIQLLACEKD